MVSWPRVTRRCQSLLEAELDKFPLLEAEPTTPLQRACAVLSKISNCSVCALWSVMTETAQLALTREAQWGKLRTKGFLKLTSASGGPQSTTGLSKVSRELLSLGLCWPA